MVAAAILARAIVEVLATAHLFARKLTKMAEAGDVGAMHQIVENAAFATRHPDLSEMPKAVSILTLIEKVDRDLFPDKPVLHWYYDLLSEFSHPNYVGTQGNFGRLERENKCTTFNADHSVNDHICHVIGSASALGQLILVAVNDVAKLLPRIADLNETKLGDDQI